MIQRKYIFKLALSIILILFSSLSYAGEGEWRIIALKPDKTLPAPGEVIVVAAELEAVGSPDPNVEVVATDVYGNTISQASIAMTDNKRYFASLPITAPGVNGRYGYNATVRVGSSFKHINIQVSSEPVEEVTFSDLQAIMDNGRIRVSVNVKNSGNRDIAGLTVAGVVNPGIGKITGEAFSEYEFGQESFSLLKVDESRRVTFSFEPGHLPGKSPGKSKDKLWIGFFAGRKDNAKTRRWQIVRKFALSEEGRLLNIPLHSINAHAFYAERAIEIFSSGTPIYDELNLYRGELVSGAINEDSLPDLVYGEFWPFLFVHHFLDYDNHPYQYGLSGTGLYIWGVTGEYIESAYEKAMAYWGGWTLDGTYHPGVVELYLGIGVPFPDKITAYEYLGRIAHLIEDMTTPAHTHSDIHGIYIDDDEFEENYEPGIDPDTGRPRYEKYNEGSAVWAYWRDYIGARNFMDFAELFTKINNHTDYFPSDDYEGDSNNFTNPWNIPQLKRNDIIYYDILGIDHYKLPGMRNLADWISPLNVMSVAATYKYFWDDVHITLNTREHEPLY